MLRDIPPSQAQPTRVHFLMSTARKWRESLATISFQIPEMTRRIVLARAMDAPIAFMLR